MKKLLFIFLLWQAAYGQTSLSFTAIGGGTDVPTYGRGAEVWINRRWDNTSGQGVNMPAGNSTRPPTNYYTRFLWRQEAVCNCGIEGNTLGSYTFTAFDIEIKRAMDNHQMFSFRVMPVCDGCGGTVPSYVQTLIEANGNVNLRGYNSSDGTYIPNWNNPDYLVRYRAMLAALKAHIDATSYTPSWSGSAIPFSKVIYEVDIGGYGNYGEWHQFPWVQDAGFPSRIIPTATTLDSLINMNLNVFPLNQAVILIAAFGAGSGAAGNQYEPPTEVGYRALTSSNLFGQIGWRRDNWGDPQYSSTLENNSRFYNTGTGNVSFAPLIMNKYKFAPVTGEPLNTISDNYADLGPEVTRYHAAGVGNGNINNPTNGTTQANYQAAMLSAGFRLVLTGGAMTTTLTSGTIFNLQIVWSNTGLAPVYENWNVKLELRNPATQAVVWSGTSTFNPKPLLPGTPLTQNDNFTLGTVANGTYSLYMGVTDPVSYKLPLALAITGRGADGYYLIRSGISVGGTANIPPTAAITGSSNITLPTSTVALSGTGSTDPDGTITAYLWSKFSGPAGGTPGTPTASTCTMSALQAGTYIFQLTVTDNNGATDTALKTVNVNNANIPPTAVITGSSSITLPTSSVALSGTSSSDPDGSISAYAWSQSSGPNSATVGTPTASTSTMSGLIAGTYVFKLTVTDNGGATGTITKNVVVNAPASIAPTAQAGGPFAITLPLNSVVADGSTSFGNGGATISSYAWTQLSGGPNTAVIQSASSAATNITGLIAGTYNFKLVVTDNNSLTGADTLIVVVSAASPTGPLSVFTSQTPGGQGGTLSGFTTQTPSAALTNDGQGLNIGIKFRSSVAASVTGVRFYKQVGNNGTHSGQLYNSAGTLLASGTFTNETASGWQILTFSSPVSILANTTYTAAYFTPNGTYADDDNYFSTAVTNGTITLLANGTDGPNGVYKYLGSASFPSLDNGFKPNYWVDVIVSNGGNLVNDGQGINLGMKFTSSIDAFVTGVRFYKVLGNNGTHVGEIYSSTGIRLASAVFTTETTSGWQNVTFSSPILIQAGLTYVVSYFSPNGTYTKDANYFTVPIQNNTLTAITGAGVYTYQGSTGFPSTSGANANYWVDVLVAPNIGSSCGINCFFNIPYRKVQ